MKTHSWSSLLFKDFTPEQRTVLENIRQTLKSLGGDV